MPFVSRNIKSILLIISTNFYRAKTSNSSSVILWKLSQLPTTSTLSVVCQLITCLKLTMMYTTVAGRDHSLKLTSPSNSTQQMQLFITALNALKDSRLISHMMIEWCCSDPTRTSKGWIAPIDNSGSLSFLQLKCLNALRNLSEQRKLGSLTGHIILSMWDQHRFAWITGSVLAKLRRARPL